MCNISLWTFETVLSLVINENRLFYHKCSNTRGCYVLDSMAVLMSGGIFRSCPCVAVVTYKAQLWWLPWFDWCVMGFLYRRSETKQDTQDINMIWGLWSTRKQFITVLYSILGSSEQQRSHSYQYLSHTGDRCFHYITLGMITFTNV